MMSFDRCYTKFLDTLEKIAEEHSELFDTVVRERLHEVISWYFIWGKPIDNTIPKLYGMFSPEGDTLVAGAVLLFLEEASVAAANMQIGAERNAAMENIGITTTSGAPYDAFVGSFGGVLPAIKPESDDLYGYYVD